MEHLIIPLVSLITAATLFIVVALIEKIRRQIFAMHPPRHRLKAHYWCEHCKESIKPEGVYFKEGPEAPDAPGYAPPTIIHIDCGNPCYPKGTAGPHGMVATA